MRKFREILSEQSNEIYDTSAAAHKARMEKYGTDHDAVDKLRTPENKARRAYHQSQMKKHREIMGNHKARDKEYRAADKMFSKHSHADHKLQWDPKASHEDEAV